MIDFDMDVDKFAKIKVIGVGGGGRKKTERNNAQFREINFEQLLQK